MAKVANFAFSLTNLGSNQQDNISDIFYFTCFVSLSTEFCVTSQCLTFFRTYHISILLNDSIQLRKIGTHLKADSNFPTRVCRRRKSDNKKLTRQFCWQGKKPDKNNLTGRKAYMQIPDKVKADRTKCWQNEIPTRQKLY